MLKKIIGTAGTKIISALLSFIIISMNAHFLGASAVGTIALIILGITIVLLFGSLGGGAALVYLTPRHAVTALYLPSFIWALISALAISYVLILFGWVPQEYKYDLYFLSALRALSGNHSAILLGKEKIKTNNIITLAEIGTLITAVVVFYFFFEIREVRYYIFALYISYSTHFLLSFIMISRYLSMKEISIELIQQAFIKTLRYSSYIQTASFFQLLNYRLSYYFLEYFSGRATLGVYTVGTRISESLWIISKSMSTVQFARIANKDDIDYSNLLTVKLFRLALFVTTVLTIVLLLIPTEVYVWIFSAQFDQIKYVLIGMSIGIISLACSMSFSSYFSGIGKQNLNTYGSLIGLLLTLGGGFLLIPKFGLLGAATTASLSYLSTTVFYFYNFVKMTRISLRSFIPGKADFVMLRNQFSELMEK